MELKIELRSVQGKSVRALRLQGIIPANIYGQGMASQAVQLSAAETERAFRSLASDTVIDLTGGSDSYKVVVRHVDREPLNGSIRHIDFMRAG